MTTRIRWTVLLVFGVCAAAGLAGCSGEKDSSSTESSTRETKTTSSQTEAKPEADDQATAKLSVNIEQLGSKETGSSSIKPDLLRCTKSIPASCSGEIACPVAEDDRLEPVCAWLTGDGKDVLTTEPPADQVCTMIYGGPEVATVTGTVDDTDIDASFVRTDGCAISRFDDASPLWTGVVEPAGAEPVDDCGASDAAPSDPDAVVSSDDPSCATPAVPPTTAPGAPGASPGSGAGAGPCVATPPDSAASGASTKPAGGAAECAPPSVPAPPSAEIISDPPEAFESAAPPAR